MEEILASIRRIIADDQDRAPRLRPDLPPEPTRHETKAPVAVAPEFVDEVTPPEPEAPPLVEPAAEAKAAFAAFEAADLAEARFEAEPELEPASPPIAAEAHPVPPAGLVSEAAGAAVTGSFGRLAATLHPPQPARTMEEHVSEMLRPMLQAWLDENLPALVERLVEAEIERLARQRR